MIWQCKLVYRARSEGSDEGGMDNALEVYEEPSSMVLYMMQGKRDDDPPL